MKIDLWQCDRCGMKKEQPSALGTPSGWIAVTVTKSKEDSRPQEKHFCPPCATTFADWASGPEHTVSVQCPDCSSRLYIIHGMGLPWLKSTSAGG